MTENKILKWSLILSIVIVANLFFNYSLSLTLNSPKHEEYCPFEKTSQVVETREQCDAADGIWNPAQLNNPEMKPIGGYCDLYSKCSNAFEEANKVYEQKVFVALVVIGVLILIASLFLKSNSLLVSAFALTAVLNFIIATMRYWRYSDELLKVAILFIALIVLIYMAIRKFKDRN